MTARDAGPSTSEPIAAPVGELGRLARKILRQDAELCSVSTAERQLTYGELAWRVSELQPTIAALAGPARTSVAIVGRPGPAMYVALLATILADKVPALIDCLRPAGRVHREIQAVRPAVVVTDSQAGDDPMPTGPARIDVAGVDDLVALTAPPVDGWTARQFDPRVGYLGFTSGSSGTPKVILGNGDGLAHFVSWQRTTFGITPSDRFAQLTSPSFDVFYRDVLTPLASGATLIPAPEGQSRGLGVLDWLAAAGITHLHTVPSLARYWLRETPPSPARLTVTFFAGEPVPGKLVEAWRAATGPVQRIVSFYGAAEATLAQTWYEVAGDAGPGNLPAGVPRPDVTVTVTDDCGRACPPGVTGEVLIESDLISFGYLEPDAADPSGSTVAPGRTGEPVGQATARFPAVADGARRLYRTGDLGCWRDGLLHLVGRRDREVKVRGVRGNLDEVAAVLVEHPLVEQALVVTAKDAFGGTVLHAYVVAGGDRPTGKHLREHVRLLLPDPLVPTHYHVLAELSRGYTGKASPPAELEPTDDTD